MESSHAVFLKKLPCVYDIQILCVFLHMYILFRR